MGGKAEAGDLHTEECGRAEMEQGIEGTPEVTVVWAVLLGQLQKSTGKLRVHRRWNCRDE